jgi:hypothetical protein
MVHYVRAPDYLDSGFAPCPGPEFANRSSMASIRRRISQPHVVKPWPGLLPDVVKYKHSNRWGDKWYERSKQRNWQMRNEDELWNEEEVFSKVWRCVLDQVSDVAEDHGLNVAWEDAGPHNRPWPGIDMTGYITGPPVPDLRRKPIQPGRGSFTFSLKRIHSPSALFSIPSICWVQVCGFEIETGGAI